MRIVSQLDHHGYFLGPTEADPSPLEPGVYLLPGGAVDAPPPNAPANHRARWVDGAWVFEPVGPPPTPPSSPPPTDDTGEAHEPGEPDEPAAGQDGTP